MEARVFNVFHYNQHLTFILSHWPLSARVIFNLKLPMSILFFSDLLRYFLYNSVSPSQYTLIYTVPFAIAIAYSCIVLSCRVENMFLAIKKTKTITFTHCTVSLMHCLFTTRLFFRVWGFVCLCTHMHTCVGESSFVVFVISF